MSISAAQPQPSASTLAGQPQLTVADALSAVAQLYGLVSRAVITADALSPCGAQPMLLRNDALRDYVAAALWVLRARSLLENNGVAAALSAVLASPCNGGFRENEDTDELGHTGLELRRLLLSVSVATDADRAATDDEEVEESPALPNDHGEETEISASSSSAPTRRSLRQQGVEYPTQPQRSDMDVSPRKTKMQKQKFAMKVGLVWGMRC